MTLVRKVYGGVLNGLNHVWACYAETGGVCHKPAGAQCACDGWNPFLVSWGGLGRAIEEDDPRHDVLVWSPQEHRSKDYFVGMDCK